MNKVLSVLLCITAVLLPVTCSIDDSGNDFSLSPLSTDDSENDSSFTPLSTVDTEYDSLLTPLTTIEDAFRNHQSNLQITQQGTIIAVLADDTDGDRHQRMIVELANGQTLLIAHNIDIAPRVPNPEKGEVLRFYGEYAWNDEGGVVHWTHKDPSGVHPDGWLEYDGKRYQ